MFMYLRSYAKSQGLTTQVQVYPTTTNCVFRSF